MIFDIKGSNEIGRKFPEGAVEPYSYNGSSLTTWQSVQKTKYFMESLHILEIGFARIFASSCKNFPERLSIPAVLTIFISFNNFSTKPSVTFEKLNLLVSTSKIF